MPFNPAKHHRRSIRLQGYDYAQQGAYFITICTYGKQCALGEVVNGEMVLNTIGCIVDACWANIPKHFPQVALDTYTVMPNHLHGIIVIAKTDDLTVAAQRAAPLQQLSDVTQQSHPVQSLPAH